MNKNKGLGRGLEALLRTPQQEVPAAASTGNTGTVEVPLDELATGNYQPRGEFHEASLSELADSIRVQGILQPLIVRPRASVDGVRYEIVAGERRWRAARMAGLAAVPVIVRDLDDQSALAVALIENLQREDLNPLDQARSLARLASEFELTHEEVARAVGRSRASVSNLLRLLELQDEVKMMLADGRIQMGHARAMLPLDAKRQVALARRCSRKGFSVRQVEDRVRRQLDGAAADKPQKPPTDLQTRWLQTQLRAELGPDFSIRPVRDGGYGLNLAFEDLAELEASLEKLLDLLRKIRSAAGPRARESAPQSAS